MIREVFYRNPHNYDLDLASSEGCPTDFGPSLTVQSDADDVDMNVIMHRFGVTGKFPENLAVPTFGDYSEVFDFRSAHEAVIKARHDFERMPADVRAKFQNDPQVFLDFCENPDNIPSLVKMGMVVIKEGYNVDGTRKDVGAASAASGGSAGAHPAAVGGSSKDGGGSG